MENIEAILNLLEDEILNARKTLIGNNVVVNADICKDLLLRIRENLPASIKEAGMITENSEQIKRDAQFKATEMLNNARINAENMIKQSEIVRQAENEAEIIRNQALQQKDKADYAARRRVDELLEVTEKRKGCHLGRN